jgi:CheY-like chemotaxis protein
MSELITGGGHRVLVVEDEVIVRMDIAAQLAGAGFAVLEARNADDAIRLLETNRDIRAVFTDVDMPGSMDGLKLAGYVARRWPPIRIIVTSGHVNVPPGTLPEGARFFTKPYDAAEVVGTMADMIGR